MKTVFIIEDDEILRENLENLLKFEGFKVLSSETGKEGISRIKEILPDAVICDIMLPDTDGYQIINEIKSDPETRNISFIFLSAKAEMKDLRTGMNLGADDYLTKPYDAMELVNVVRKRIEISGTRIAAEQNEIKENKIPLHYEGQLLIQTTGNQAVPVKIKDIVSISADADYTHLYITGGKKLTLRKLIKHWEQTLPSQNFMRVHKSIIINTLHIVKVDKWFNNSFRIEMEGLSEPVITSRRYGTKLRNILFS